MVFSDLDSSWFTDLGARSSPAAAKRCAEGAGLEGAPKSVNLIEEIANTFLLQHSCVSFSYGFVPIQGEPFAWRAALAAPTYIRPGSTRSKIPHAHCEGAGSKGDGTFLFRGVFQP